MSGKVTTDVRLMKHKTDGYHTAIGKKKPEKIRASTGFEPVTSAIPVRCPTNWAMKPQIFQCKQLERSPDFFRLLLSNCLNWKIYGDDHSSLQNGYRTHTLDKYFTACVADAAYRGILIWLRLRLWVLPREKSRPMWDYWNTKMDNTQ